ncbi:MAG TPA: carbohydrate binding domain-containing protein [Polyangiaceae bacterium]|nr:carbohydrate binding domain-containing protein [Polyangiaceae bacterium]
MNKGRIQILSSVVLATCLGVAANGCGGGDDDNGGGSSATGGTAGKGAGGKAGGGAAGASGHGGGAGGTGGSAGASATGGGAGTNATGGAGLGAGGSAGISGSAGVGTGGTVAQGGTAGTTTGMGGAPMGGMGGMPSYCYESLYVPLAMENDQADFEIDYGDSTPVNLSATTLSVRLRAETTGNAGGLQVYVKDGSAQNYAVAYLGWNNLTDLSSFTTLTYDLSQATGGTGFDPTVIRYVGINVTAGSTFDGATWAPATVYVDSITFSDGATPNLDFNDGVVKLNVNQYNSPVTGATASAAICQDETGSGGMGGMSGSSGVAGSSASGGIGGQLGTGGTEAGAAGMSGEGGVAGADEGTGGSSVTGGTGGSAGTSGGGAGNGGTSSGGAGNGGAGGKAGAGGNGGASGHAGAGGSGGASANLITNGDFESDTTTGWSSWGTGTFQVSTVAHSGTYSLLVTNRTGSNLNILQDVSAVVSVGHTYAVSGWVRTSVAATGHFTVEISCANAGNSYVWLENPAVNLSNTGWTELTGTIDLTTACTSVANDTLTGVDLYLEGPAASVDVYLDDVTMTQN